MNRLSNYSGYLARWAPALPDVARAGRARLVAASELVRTLRRFNLYFLTFVLLVLAPTAARFLYAALLETPRYVAEARVSVRGAIDKTPTSSDAGALISRFLGGSNTSGQDIYVVKNYIRSAAIIVDLGGTSYVEKRFAAPGVDLFSGLSPGKPIEEVLQYWLDHVTATVDTLSGILTLKVDAFTPETASGIARDVVNLSERLLNTMTERSRKDAVARAENEVSVAADRLADVRERLRAFRNANSMIDPASKAASIGEAIAKLEMKKIEIQNEMATFRGNLSDNSPTVKLLRNQLGVVQQQIDELQKNLTGGKRDDTVSAQMAGFERLRLDEQFAEKLYTIAQSSYLRARQELEKQQSYLAVVVPPALPGEASYPRTIGSTLLTLLVCLIFWAVGALVAASVSDHMV